MISESTAKKAATKALETVAGEAKPAAVQSLMAIARLETAYGWIKGAETNNWGAVQCGHAPPAIPGECIELTDSHQGGEKYQWCYKTFSTPEEGAIFLAKTLKRMGCLPYMASGDARGLAKQMYLSGYYGGVSQWGKKGIPNPKQDPRHQEKVIGDYSRGIVNNAKASCKALGEPLLLTVSSSWTGTSNGLIGGALFFAVFGLLSALASKGSRK